MKGLDSHSFAVVTITHIISIILHAKSGKRQNCEFLTRTRAHVIPVCPIIIFRFSQWPTYGHTAGTGGTARHWPAGINETPHICLLVCMHVHETLDGDNDRSDSQISCLRRGNSVDIFEIPCGTIVECT